MAYSVDGADLSGSGPGNLGLCVPFTPIKPNQKFCSQRCGRKVRFARYVQRKAAALAGKATNK